MKCKKCKLDIRESLKNEGMLFCLCNANGEITKEEGRAMQHEIDSLKAEVGRWQKNDLILKEMIVWLTRERWISEDE